MKNVQYDNVKKISCDNNFKNYLFIITSLTGF